MTDDRHCPDCGKEYADCDAYLRDEGVAHGENPANYCQRGAHNAATNTSPPFEFRDPPKRTERETEVLSALMEHPNRWALVAEGVRVGVRNRWVDARRKVGGHGEFKIRQVSCGPDTGRVDLYVRYTPQDES